MKRMAGLLALAFAIVCCAGLSCCASAESTLSPLEWSWTPGDAATFEGSVTLPENAPETVTLRLSVSPQPAEQDVGEIVFTYINDRRLTVRKQAAEYTLSTAEQSGPVTFRGSWVLPEDTYFSAANLTLSVHGEDGTELLSRSFSFSEDDESTQSGGRSILRLPFNLNRVTMWLGIAAGAVWCLAILRMVISGRKRSAPRRA